MTAGDVTGFCAFFSARKSGNFLHILGRFPYRITQKTWRHRQKTHGRKFKKSSGETRNCRFLSLVVVERVLRFRSPSILFCRRKIARRLPPQTSTFFVLALFSSCQRAPALGQTSTQKLVLEVCMRDLEGGREGERERERKKKEKKQKEKEKEKGR